MEEKYANPQPELIFQTKQTTKFNPASFSPACGRSISNEHQSMFLTHKIM
jgi:hypothetical protein